MTGSLSCIGRNENRGVFRRKTRLAGRIPGGARTLWGMREYTVRLGDSPASIAARPDMAGCPKCGGIDFVRANPHKEAVTYPNGFTTFKNLRVGEKLNLPDKWFSKEFDERPKKYFAALPAVDGKTPSSLGLAAAAGVLADYSAFDTAVSTIASLASMTPQSFSNAVDAACTLIDQSVHEADGSTNPGIAAYAQAVHLSTNAARQANQVLVSALTSGDQAAITKARADIQQNLTTALDAAKMALQAVYGGGSPATPATPTTPAVPTIPQDTIKAVAQAVAAAVAADPNYCASVSQAGSAMNTAIHAFKSAWNAANPSSPVPINTGTYEQATADALARVLGSAPPACGARGGATPSPSIPGGIVPPQPSEGLSTGALVGLSLLGVGAVGGAIYLVTQNPPRKPRVRRARPRREQNPMIRPRGPRYDTVAWRKP